ncbi:MAG: hypothetical protein KDD70_08755, partial [Bdellovibrionales bacterium]|nr:hypothetical protein [Bdellovibrionales bacterium]
MRDRVERKLSTQGVGLDELKSVGTRPYSPSHEETVLPVEVEKLVHALRQRDSRSIGAMYELFPELLILAGGQRGAEAVPAPIEGKQEVPGISKSIFGKSHPEFDRAAVGILSLVDILEGSEAGWRRLTADTTRLSWETYQELSQQAQKWLPTPEHIHRAITCIIVSNATKADISTWSVLEHIVSPGVAKKTHTAIESIASNWMEKEVDVQIALGEALHKTEKISPSFAGLDKKTKNDFISALRTGFSIPQMMQLESPAGSLNQALSLSSSAKDLMCAHFLADLAGAIGHLDSDGSRTLTESTAQNFLQVAACLRGDNAKELYDNYVGFIAAKIGINCETSEGYAITRIAAMLRLDSPLEGRELEEAFNAIGIREREVLALELGKSGIGEETAILAYFSPALFNNLRRTFGSDRLNFQRACSEGMELLAECFTIGRTAVTEEYPLTNSLSSSVFRLDIGEVARATHEPGRLREKALKHSVVQEGRVGKVLVRDTEEILAGPSPLHFNAHRPNAALHSLVDAVVRETSDRLSQKTVHMIIEEDGAEDSLNRGEFLAALRIKSRHLKHQINALSVFLPKSLGAELPAQLTPPEEVLELMDPELNLPSKDLAPIPKPLKTALMALRIYLQECDFAVADNAPRAYHRIHELVRERINDLETWIGEHAEFFGKDENPLPTNYRIYQPKKVTAGLLESLSGIAHGQIYRPGDPRIIDFGNSSHLTRDEMIRHLDNGARLHIVRDRLGYLSGEGIVFDSTMAERFKPEIVEPYIDTYERVGFIQYIGLHRS